MKTNESTPLLNKNLKKPNLFLIFLLVFLLLASIGLGMYTIMTQQLSTKSRAEDTAPAIEEVVVPTQVPAVTEPSPESSTPADSVSPTVAESAPEPSTTVAPVTPTVADSVPGASLLDETITPTLAPEPTLGSVTPTTPEATVAPTQALVSTLSCPANGASCAWDGVAGADSYSVTIIDKTTNDVVVTQTISGTSVSFTPIIEHTYECSVLAINECGTSGVGKGQNTCRANVVPTIPPQATSTPTPGPSATPGPGPSATPGPGPSATPGQPGTVIVKSVTGVAEPTIPTAGSSSSVYFMVVATILVATLFLVF